jgi:PLAC8 family
MQAGTVVVRLAAAVVLLKIAVCCCTRHYNTYQTMMLSSPSTWDSEKEPEATQSKYSYQPKTIRVLAPATLEQDFTFDVTLGGKHGNRPYTVTVPVGGVVEGEEFDIPYPSWDEYSNGIETDDEDARPDDHLKNDGTRNDNNNDGVDDDDDVYDDNYGEVHEKKTLPCQSNSHDEETATGMISSTDATGAPTGRWRYHLLSCCDVVTQSTFWMSLFCIPVMIAQLVSRLHLSYQGVPAFNVKTRISATQTVFEEAAEEISLSYNKIVLSFVAVLCFTNCLPAVGLIVVVVYVFLLMVFVGSNIRRSMRHKYNIPLSIPFLQALRRCFCRPLPKKGVKVSKSRRANEEGGGYVEDCLCLLFCGCCSLIQMGRHTHDDKEYPGYCCTTTGLEAGAPKIV